MYGRGGTVQGRGECREGVSVVWGRGDGRCTEGVRDGAGKG